MMRNLLLLSLFAFASTVASGTRAGESPADILRSLDRAPAAASSTNALPAESGRGAAWTTDSGAMSGALTAGVPMPDQMAARYISDYVDPKIKEALARLPENERAAAIAHFDAFKAQLRGAIADYEKVEVTPEKAETILRNDHVKPDLVAYFMERAAAYKTRISDPAEVTRLAYLDMAERRDRRVVVSEHVIDDYFRRGVYRSEHDDLTGEQRTQAAVGAGVKLGDSNKITMLDYLLKAGAPGGLKFPAYGRIRQDIQQQILSSLAAAPQQESGPTQGTPPKTTLPAAHTSGPAQQECDTLAASTYDQSRPAGVLGVESDKIDAPRAEAACRRAVEEQPSPRAYLQLGRALDAGRKYAEAARNYRIAAAQGNPVAQYLLGKLYDNGEGIAKDASQAAFWYLKAAKQGYGPAQNDLGSMYYNGEGVASDDAEAIFWFQKAADQGIAQAQRNLALVQADKQQASSANSEYEYNRQQSTQNLNDWADQERARQNARNRQLDAARQREQNEMNERRNNEIQRNLRDYNSRR
jgi:TPR repeat protein